MTETVRTFIAIELSPEIKDELAKLQAELKPAGADVKWVNPAAIHITLKFLGDITKETIEEIGKILDGISSKHKKFELSLFQIGAFRSWNIRA